MKAIILAAGMGKRLRPLTNDRPKCMVKYNNKPIINYLLDTFKQSKINDIAIVCGYKKDVLKNYLKEYKLTFFENNNFDKTNMVETLFCAKDFMDKDLIISYSDIIYKKEVLEKLINSKYDFSVIVDKNWKKLWQKRMEDPLEDAETLKIKDGKIIELGKKPKNYDEIEGQYIGLFKISKNILSKIISFYMQNNFNKNIYMTDFIQSIIDNNIVDIKPIFINGGWIEIDNKKDLEVNNE